MSIYELKIGDIECAVLQEGEATKPIERIAERYPSVPRAELEAALGGDLAYDSLNCLYINSGGTGILADVGFGDAGPPGMGGVMRGLGSMGIALADIDIIYLTHFHGDHIAGLSNADGSLAYPKARYVATQAEWDEWTARWSKSESVEDRRLLDRFDTLQDRFSFVNPGEQVAPGVTVVNLAGHTRGHSGLLIESGGERLLHVVDLLHQPFQFKHVNWHFSFDTDSELAVATRRRVLQRCVDEALLTLFYHLEFPGLGTVSKEGEIFVWNPIA